MSSYSYFPITADGGRWTVDCPQANLVDPTGFVNPLANPPLSRIVVSPLSSPAFVTTSSLTPTGLAAMNTQVTGYLTAAKITTIQGLLMPGAALDINLKFGSVIYPVLLADIVTQAGDIVAILNTAANVT